MEETYGCFAFEGAGSSPSRLKGRDATGPSRYVSGYIGPANLSAAGVRFVFGVAGAVYPAEV